MLRRSLTAFLVCSVALAAVPAQAADSPTELLPESTSVVIRLKQPQATVQKLTKLATAVDPQIGPAITLVTFGMGSAISNPSQAGVDTKGDWWIALYMNRNDEPSVAFVVPATDVDAMKDGVQGEFSFATKDNWVAYSEDADVIRKIQQSMRGQKKTLGKVIDEDSQRAFDAGDLSVYVNLPSIRDTYENELKMVRSQVADQLDQLGAIAPEVPGINMAAVFKMYGQMFEGVLQSVDDAQGVTTSLHIRTKGLVFSEYLRVAKGTKTSKFLASHPSATLDGISALPNGQLGYMGAHGDANGLLEWSMKMTADLFQGGEGNKLKRVVESTLKDYSKINFGAYLASFNFGEIKDGALRSTTIIEAKPADKYKELSRTTSKQMGELGIGGVKSDVTVTPDAETYGTRKADIINVKQDVSPELDPLGVQKQIMEAFYGKGGITTRVVSLDSKIVQTVGGGKKAMEEALQAASDQKTDSALMEARKRLPQKANLLVLFDLPGLVADAMRIVANSDLEALDALPIDPAAFKNLKVDRTYMGLAITMEAEGLRGVTYLPVSQIKNLVEIGKQLQALQNFRPEL